MILLKNYCLLHEKKTSQETVSILEIYRKVSNILDYLKTLTICTLPYPSIFLVQYYVFDFLETIEYFFFVSVCLYYEIYSTCIATFLCFTKTRMFMQIHICTLSVALGVIYISDIEHIHII